MIWFAVLIAVGFLLICAAVFMMKEYLAADVRFRAEATLVDIDRTAETRLKKDRDKNDPFEEKYETVYNYELTWSFKDPYIRDRSSDPYADETRLFVSDRQSKYENAFSIGDKRTVYIYYTTGTDYEIMDFVGTAVGGGAGAFFIVTAFAELAASVKKRRAREKFERAAREAAEKRRSGG